MSIFIEISILLAITTVITLGVRLLKQPLVVGYILSGIVAGPYLLNVLHSQDELQLFSKVGIVFLLFVVGLHLNPKVIKEVGVVSLITGMGQVLFTSLIGFGLALLLGISLLEAVYVAIALTFSSTIIILKLLSDRGDLHKLYAKIAVGFLLVQDIVATLVLIAVTVVSSPSDKSISYVLAEIGVKGLAIVIALILIAKYVLPRLLQYVAKSQEFLFLFSLAWGTGLAALFYVAGFSIEIGALVAGVTLSVSPFADEIASRLKPLRDFFIVIFFLLLGSQMVLSNIGQIVIPALVFSVFVLVGNPLIVIILMLLSGYKLKTGFLSGLTVAQISEFSLILATLAFEVGHISQQTLSLITLVGLITIAGSTYLIMYADQIFDALRPYLKPLKVFARSTAKKEVQGEDHHTILFGYSRVGKQVFSSLVASDHEVLVVEINPEAVSALDAEGVAVTFGDAADVEFLQELPASKPQLIISTIPDITTNRLIIKTMKQRNQKVAIVAIAYNHEEAHELYDLGVSYVIVPHHLGAEQVIELFEKHGTAHSSYHRAGQRHRNLLRRRFPKVDF